MVHLKVDTTKPARLNERLSIRFGLQSFLIGMTIFGVLIGILGRLWERSPEVVVTLLKCSPIILLLLNLYLAIRLRNKRLPLVFGLLIGTGLLVLSLIGLTRVNTVQLLSNKYLIRKRLGKDMDDHTAWREIERRLINQQFTKEDTDFLITLLLESGILDRSKPRKPPFYLRSPVQRQWLNIAVQRGLISNEHLMALADQHFGPPQTRRLRLTEGREIVGLYPIQYGKNMIGFPLQIVWEVKSAELDGREVQVHPDENFRLGSVNEEFSVGKHQLQVQLACGYTWRDHVKLGTALRGSLPQKDWPPTLREWKTTATLPIDVYPENERIVRLVKSADRDPSEFIEVSGVTFMDPVGGKPGWISVNAKAVPYPNLPLPVPLSFDVFLLHQNKRIEAGSFWAFHDSTGKLITNILDRKTIVSPIGQALDETCDIELVPSPKNKKVVRFTNVTEAWGKPITFKNRVVEEFVKNKK